MKKKATPKTIFEIKNKIREVTHIYNNQPLIGKIMTEEERKRLALKRKNKKFFDDYKKSITGVAAGEKEMEILTKSIPNLTQKKDTSEKGTMADFVSKMGGSVSEEELKRIKALISKR